MHEGIVSVANAGWKLGGEQLDGLVVCSPRYTLNSCTLDEEVRGPGSIVGRCFAVGPVCSKLRGGKLSCNEQPLYCAAAVSGV